MPSLSWGRLHTETGGAPWCVSSPVRGRRVPEAHRDTGPLLPDDDVPEVRDARASEGVDAANSEDLVADTDSTRAVGRSARDDLLDDDGVGVLDLDEEEPDTY